MTRMACLPPLTKIEATFSQALEAACGMVATRLILALFDANGLLFATLTRRDTD